VFDADPGCCGHAVGLPISCTPAGGPAEVALWRHAQGVLAYELIVGRPPFEKETRAATYECIMYRKPPYPSWLSDSARSFIDTALHKARSWLSSVSVDVLCVRSSRLQS
jgi:serine/threonine protein kinase